MTNGENTPVKPLGPTFWILSVIAVLVAVMTWYMIFGEDWLDRRAFCLSDQRQGLDTLYDYCMERVSNL